MAKASGDDDLRREAQSKINQLTNKYSKLCNASGLPTQKERMSVSGFRSVKEKSQLKSFKTIDNTAKSGIMKLAAEGKADVSVYEIKENLESVKFAVDFAKNELKISIVDFDSLKNSEVIWPFLNRTKELQDEYGVKYNAIKINPLMKGTRDIAQVTRRKVLEINPDFFNSKQAMQDVLNEFLKERRLPKGCNNIDYVAKHEYMHLLTMDDIDNPRSLVHKLFRRTKASEFVSINSAIDEYEFVADYLSLDKPNKIADKLKKYYGME